MVGHKPEEQNRFSYKFVMVGNENVGERHSLKFQYLVVWAGVLGILISRRQGFVQAGERRGGPRLPLPEGQGGGLGPPPSWHPSRNKISSAQSDTLFFAFGVQRQNGFFRWAGVSRYLRARGGRVVWIPLDPGGIRHPGINFPQGTSKK